MPDIEMPDPEELGGNVTKPFKFVTGTTLSCDLSVESDQRLTCCSWYKLPFYHNSTFLSNLDLRRLRCSLP